MIYMRGVQRPFLQYVRNLAVLPVQWSNEKMMALLKTGCCEIIFTITRFKFSKSLYFEAI